MFIHTSQAVLQKLNSTLGHCFVVMLTAIFALLLVSSCSLISASSTTLDTSILLKNNQPHVRNVDITGRLTKQISFTAALNRPYANLSILADDRIILNNISIPTQGKHPINALVNFKKRGVTKLTFVARSADIDIQNIQFNDVGNLVKPSFKDVSTSVGFNTTSTYKYGGPAVADYDNDGDYDFALNNHNHVPTQLVTQDADGQFNIKGLFDASLDFHGSSFGDYDQDGDVDLIVARGGANGTNPTSYILVQNNNGTFETIDSSKTGIQVPARGRTPKWIDLDLDGDLDLMLINAQTPNSDEPIQLFYKNDGTGNFERVRVKGIEYAYAERALVTDYNQDGIDDVLLFSPISLWQGLGNFAFKDVSDILPEHIKDSRTITAATDIDIDNDGTPDLYLANGKNHYNISRKSIDHNAKTERLDIRDDGETGTTAINFTAGDEITLKDLDLTYRQYNGNYPLFLGKAKTRRVINAEGFQPIQRPKEMQKAPFELTIHADDAQGWPEDRSSNGVYIGYLGGDKWQAEWVREQNVYWTVTFSMLGVTSVDYDWAPNNRNVQDVLLQYKDNKYQDVSQQWNIANGGNSWGVTRADFNNDGWQDLFVYRYGYLKERIADILMLNTGNGKFEITTMHGAFDPADSGHGDMGQAFDFNNDGKVDMLNGSEEKGRWYLHKNNSTNLGNYLLFKVPYSPKHNVDPYSATVKVTTNTGNVHKQRVSSAGSAFSQSLLDIVHFGLGEATEIQTVEVRWRNGEKLTLQDVKINSFYAAK